VRIAQVATSDISVRFLLLEHIRALSEMGHEVTAVCSPGRWVDEIRQRGIEVETVAMSRELHPLRDARSLRALMRCFKKNGFDVVHTHTPKAGLLGPLAARLAGVPMIVHTVHGLLFHDAQSRALRNLYWLPEKMTAMMSHYLLSQSREDIEVCVRTGICAANKISYLGNGIDTDRFKMPSADFRRSARATLGFGENDFVFGSVGRLVYEKGFGELFEAAESVRAAHARARFVVIGPEEDDQRDAITTGRIRDLANRGIVLFTGMQTDGRVCSAFASRGHSARVHGGCRIGPASDRQ
jgi:glycosyltransferase involved in cell wall biosynthesis